MLTVMLLVVLGGGAGLLAVWLVDPGSLRRFAGRTGARSLRAPRRQVTPPADPEPEPPAADEPVPAGSGGVEVLATAPAGPTRRPDPTPAAPDAPSRRRGRGSVPAAFTAIEGSYRDVAVTPLWRKVVSLVLLLAVLLAAGIAAAALTGAALGLVAELVDGAIE